MDWPFAEVWRLIPHAESSGKYGYPNALVHDMRRSAVRTFERAGVPRSVAMSIVGHKTESIYRRYAIVDELMQREAAARLDAWVGAASPSMGTVATFEKAKRPRRKVALGKAV